MWVSTQINIQFCTTSHLFHHCLLALGKLIKKYLHEYKFVIIKQKEIKIKTKIKKIRSSSTL